MTRLGSFFSATAVCTILANTFWNTSTNPLAWGFSGAQRWCLIPFFSRYFWKSWEEYGGPPSVISTSMLPKSPVTRSSCGSILSQLVFLQTSTTGYLEY